MTKVVNRNKDKKKVTSSTVDCEYEDEGFFCVIEIRKRAHTFVLAAILQRLNKCRDNCRNSVRVEDLK